MHGLIEGQSNIVVQHQASEATLCGRRDAWEPVAEEGRCNTLVRMTSESTDALPRLLLHLLFSSTPCAKTLVTYKPEREISRSTSSSTHAAEQGIRFLSYLVFSVETYEARGKDWPASLALLPVSVSLAVSAYHTARATWLGLASRGLQPRRGD